MNIHNDEGETALILAVRRSFDRLRVMKCNPTCDQLLAKMLVKAGADVNVMDNDGRTALMGAIQKAKNVLIVQK